MRRLIARDEVLLPSSRARTAEMMATGDVEGLMSVLLAGRPSLSAWAREVLGTLPDEKLDELVVGQHSTEMESRDFPVVVVHRALNGANLQCSICTRKSPVPPSPRPNFSILDS